VRIPNLYPEFTYLLYDNSRLFLDTCFFTILSFPQLKMSALGKKQTFMTKILVWAKYWRNILNLLKMPFLSDFSSPQSQKSFLDLFFGREEQSKKIFWIRNHFSWQVYRIEKIGLFIHSQLTKSILIFFVHNLHVKYLNSIPSLEMCSISFNYF
jgi:hypothetical protein